MTAQRFKNENSENSQKTLYLHLDKISIIITKIKSSDYTFAYIIPSVFLKYGYVV